MPENLEDSVTGTTELVFPDDANGTYSLQERSVYDAEEVRVEIDADIPQYGKWIPVTIEETGAEGWLSAPSELRTRLVEDEIKPTERFCIEEMEKRGRDQSDPYRVMVSYPDRDGDQATQKSLAQD
jgi:hypothetical protein